MTTTMMKWVCVYCHKTMDKSNFTEFIKDSDNGVYHEWKSITAANDYYYLSPKLQRQSEGIKAIIM